MTTLRRLLGTAGLGMALLAANASASIITTTFSVYGDIPTFTAPGTNTTSAAQFNTAATNAAIAGACGAGFTCSTLTLTSIKVNITGNLSSQVSISNSTGVDQYIGALATAPGTFEDGGTSGFAVASVANLGLTNAAFGTPIVTAVPTFSIATTDQLQPGCVPGATDEFNYANCLKVVAGTTPFSGNGTNTAARTYTGASLSNATVQSVFVGTGTASFGLTLSGSSIAGTIPSGVTIPTNIATINALTNGLKIDYTYTYDRSETSATPEPMSMLLLGSGLIGVAVLRKRAVR